MKDYLEESGFQINPVTPKAVIKEAFAAKTIEDGQKWIDMMLDRNVLAHTYDQKKFRKALASVKKTYLNIILISILLLKGPLASDR